MLKKVKIPVALQIFRIYDNLHALAGRGDGFALTSYEIAKWSSVSRLTVYRNLEKLADLGLCRIHEFYKGNLKCKKYEITNETLEAWLPERMF